MIISVAAGIAMPAPRPNRNRPMPVGRYEPPSTSAACNATPPAAIIVPAVTAIRPPCMAARWAPAPVPSSIPIAAGTSAKPAASGV